jgi:hypothetical protein
MWDFLCVLTLFIHPFFSMFSTIGFHPSYPMAEIQGKKENKIHLGVA